MRHGQMRIVTALAVTWLAAPAAGQQGLHIAGDATVQGMWNVQDGAGFRWDIQPDGTVSDGNNDCYDGGMRLQINGSQISHAPGRLSADKREVEYGPRTMGTLKVWRRIYVDPKLGYCRWIEIVQNTADKPAEVQIEHYSNMGSSTQRCHRVKDKQGKNEWAFVTGQGSHRPAVAHVYATPRAKVRPTPNIQQHNDNIRWTTKMTIGPRRTVAMCSIQAQRGSFEEAQAFIEKLDLAKEARKIPMPLRRLLVNFRTATLFGEVEITRLERRDLLLDVDGSRLLGTVRNESFTIRNELLGEMELPAAQVVGMVAGDEGQAPQRLLLLDGQILSGTLSGEGVRVELAVGGELTVPFERIRQWTYAVSAERPDEGRGAEAMVELATGDRLAVVPESLHVSVKTAWATVPLPAEHLFQIRPPEEDEDGENAGADRAAARRRVVLRNGSRLTGVLEPSPVEMRLTLGKTVQVERERLVRLQLGRELPATTAPARAVMAGGDELCGRVRPRELQVQTEYGSLKVELDGVRKLAFDKPGEVTATTWDGSVLRGRIEREAVELELASGYVVALPLKHLERIERSRQADGDDVASKAEVLIARLADADDAARQRAMYELMELGPDVLDVLQKHCNHANPRVRKAVREAIHQLGGHVDDEAAAPAPPVPVPARGVRRPAVKR